MQGELLAVVGLLLGVKVPPPLMKGEPRLQIGQHLRHGKCLAHRVSQDAVTFSPLTGAEIGSFRRRVAALYPHGSLESATAA